MVQRAMRVVEPLPLTVVRTGRVLVSQGQPCPGVWRIESGVLRAEVSTREGRELILDVLGAGEVAGHPGRGPSPWTLRALRATRLRAGGDLSAGLAARERRLADLTASLLTHDVQTRVEDRLLDLARRFGRAGPGGVQIPFVVSQEDLAAMTASTRESVNRAIGRLVDQGRLQVLRRGRYLVRSQLRLVPGG